MTVRQRDRGFGTTIVCVASVLALAAQRRDAFDLSFDHPAVAYRSRTPADPVARAQASLARGKAQLSFDPDHGYLGSLLTLLGVPIESQVVVFSGGSKQADLIGASNPRAIYFSDSVAVGWVRGGAELEIAATDAGQGVNFYTLEQRRVDRPSISQDKAVCLQCHLTWETRGVPGLVVMSTLNEPAPDDKYSYATGSFADHRSPFSDRWGGWYVTGRIGPVRHLGNDTALPGRKAPPVKPPRQLDSLKGLFDPRGFPSLHSDVVALMVLEHQSTMTNLLTWTAWEARVMGHGGQPRAPRPAPPGERLDRAVTETVDYMLFVDEMPLAAPMRGSSAFAERFSAAGPHDARGRSLRQFDLERRLFRFPCSYLIYSDAFEGLPEPAKAAVYERLWHVLSGQDRDARYARLSRDDRQAIVEILRETKRDLPDVFRGAVIR
jgi:hypothetical protein